MITNTPLTFAEIKSQAVFAFIYCSSFSGDYFQVSSIEKLTAKTAPLSRWPQLLAVAIVPWFTRTWATIMASKTELTKGDSITLEVEENIFNLLNSDDPAAIRKGELLQEIWEQVQLDVAAEKINWNEVLDKQYAVDVAGKRSKISLNEVASAARVDDIKFSSSSSADRYAFFGGATTLQNVNPDAVTVLQTSAAFS